MAITQRPPLDRHHSAHAEAYGEEILFLYEQELVKSVLAAAPGTSLLQEPINISVPVGSAIFKYEGTLLPTALLVSLQSTMSVSFMPTVNLGDLNGSLSGRGVFNCFDIPGFAAGCTRLYVKHGWVMFKADVCILGQAFNLNQRAYCLSARSPVDPEMRPKFTSRRSLL